MSDLWKESCLGVWWCGLNGGSWCAGVGGMEGQGMLCRAEWWLSSGTGTRREGRSRGRGEEEKDEERRRGVEEEEKKERRRGGRGVESQAADMLACWDIKKRFIDHFIDLSRHGRGKRIKLDAETTFTASGWARVFLPTSLSPPFILLRAFACILYNVEMETCPALEWMFSIMHV